MALGDSLELVCDSRLPVSVQIINLQPSPRALDWAPGWGPLRGVADGSLHPSSQALCREWLGQEQGLEQPASRRRLIAALGMQDKHLLGSQLPLPYGARAAGLAAGHSPPHPHPSPAVDTATPVTVLTLSHRLYSLPHLPSSQLPSGPTLLPTA